MLGFSVTKTKASGDQGVDLILERQDQRIAVQAKGYKKPVGNKAVQEVLGGMIYYKCKVCMVVANNIFTPNARDLAEHTGCRLIDVTQIPDLIDGQLL